MTLENRDSSELTNSELKIYLDGKFENIRSSFRHTNTYIALIASLMVGMFYYTSNRIDRSEGLITSNRDLIQEKPECPCHLVSNHE